MPHQFDREIPNWQSPANQGAGLELVDLRRLLPKENIKYNKKKSKEKGEKERKK